MKTLYRTLKTTVLAATILGSTLVYSAEALINPKGSAELVQSLQQQVLTRDQVLTEDPGLIVSDINTIKYNFVAPGTPSQLDALSIEDLLDEHDNSVNNIKEILGTRTEFSGGEKLQYILEEEQRILDNASIDINEQLAIFTIQRNIDMVNHLIAYSGHNHAEMARWFSNMSVSHLELAAAFANNNRVVENVFNPTVSQLPFQMIVIPSADFGIAYANMILSYSTNLSSQTSKAIMLMRLLGYLGWDLNSDLRRRTRPIAEAIVDVFKLQRSVSYNNIVKQLRMNKKPRSKDIARLRKKVTAIVANLNKIAGDVR